MKKILILEDDKDIIELVQYNLEKEGFRVSAVHDGLAGLTEVKKTSPDLLILDLMLPGISGLEITGLDPFHPLDLWRISKLY